MDVILAAVVGMAVGGVAFWIVGRQAARRSGVRHFGTGPSWLAPLVRSPYQMAPDEMARLRRSVDMLVGVDASALREVIGVGAASVVHDLTVELIAIEIREAGCRGILRFTSAMAGIDEAHPFAALGEPEVTVADELDTAYETGLGSWSGSPTRGEAEFHFAPRPPDDAHRLSIVIQRFRESGLPPDVWSGPRDGTPGPWEFTVEIEPGLDARR